MMRLLPVCSILALTLALTACGGDGGDDPLELTILHINDHHSSLDADESASLKLKTGSARESVSVSLGGFPRVAAAMSSLAGKESAVLKLHAGDALTGSLYYQLNEGEADARLMNTVCFDAMTVGNHEFDNGDAGLRKFIDFLHADPRCRTQVLSANLLPRAGSPLAGELIKPYTVVERDGHKIGIVGISPADKIMNSSRPDAGTRLGAEIPAAQAAIDALQAQGVRHVVLLSHLGHQQDQALAAQLSGVDVVVGGDSHTLLGSAALKDYGLSPAGDYPLITRDKDGRMVCVVQAWQYAAVVGELKVRFDEQGNVASCAGQPHVLIGDSFKKSGKPVNDQEAAAIRADIASQPALRITASDATASAALAPYKTALTEFSSSVVASASENLCLRRVPGSKRDTSRSKLDGCNADPRVVAHGGDVQQLVAAAFLAQGRTFGGADLSIQNGGGVRVDVAAGPVNVGNVYSVLPFKNTLVRLSMSGAEVKAALEDAMEGVVKGGTGGYPYTGDLRWNVDLNQPKGSRLSSLELKNGQGEWVPFDLNANYKVITIDFLADGQDGYTTLGTIRGERREDLYLAYAEAFLQYVAARPVLSRLPESDYSTRQFIDTP